MHEELVGPVPFTGWVNYQLFAKIRAMQLWAYSARLVALASGGACSICLVAVAPPLAHTVERWIRGPSRVMAGTSAVNVGLQRPIRGR